MDETTLAYLAGALDSDGFFSIKKSTYGIRVTGDRVNAGYSERVGIKQVSPIVPELLKGMFGGYVSLQKPSTTNGKPLFGYNATDAMAAAICKAVRPYLRIKATQCDCLLSLRYWRKHPEAQRYAWWWCQENPNWANGPLITTSEVVKMLGYTGKAQVAQALGNHTLVAVAYTGQGRLGEQPRFPLELVRLLAEVRTQQSNRKGVTPPQLIEHYETLYQQVRELNAIGTGQHPITMRIGRYAPIGREN
jgi:hypothetical protein